MFETDWIVSSDTVTDENNPLKAEVLCVVHTDNFEQYRQLRDLLNEVRLCAFKEKAFGKHFWSRISRPPVITVDEFRTKLDEPGWRHTHM